MSKRDSLSVIIPIHKEIQYLPLAILDIDKKLSAASLKSEIIMVASGDIGKTAEIIKNMSKTIRNLKLLENDEDNGVGQAIRQGMLLASGKYKLFTNPDNSISIDHFNQMLPHFKNGADVVVGNRTYEGSFLNRVLFTGNQVAKNVTKLIFKPLIPKGVTDTHCQFKAFTENATEMIFSPLKSTSRHFHIEILKNIKNNNYSIVEIPVQVSIFRYNL
ncbi:MAG: glycosyltransferase [bacterium]|nr:glycosyltransferase [bacterium]